SEHKMVLADFKEKGPFQKQLQLEKATLEDVELIVRIISASFGQSEEEAKKHILGDMKEAYSQYYIGKLGEEPVGSLNLFCGDKAYSIYGLGILPQYRGRGFGRQMLEQLIKS